MYLRTTKRKNKDGSVVEYFQLAHNERHSVTRKPVAKIIHNFGRTDQLDREQLVRLCRSIARVCQLTVVDPYDDDQREAKAVDGYLADGPKIEKTVTLGTVLTIEALWDKIGLRKTFGDIARANMLPESYERALLAMTANRLCSPESKLGVWDRWLDTVYLPSCNKLKLHHMYAAMDMFYALPPRLKRRSLKRTQIKMTPMYHWLSRRIEAHIKICELSLMIERIVERTCGHPWSKIACSLQKLQVTKFFNLNHRVCLRNEIPADTRNILNKYKISPPKQLVHFEKYPRKQPKSADTRCISFIVLDARAPRDCAILCAYVIKTQV